MELARPECYDCCVSVFKRLGPSHVHVRTPVLLGLVILLVLLLSAVCHYRVRGVEYLSLPSSSDT